MWHTLGFNAEKFFQHLLQIDLQVAQQTRDRGCHCGGRLHCAHYPRKPRGVPDDCEAHMKRRFSFCCATPGCRRRTTPPSVRFMGRRVYVAAAVLMACAGWSDVDASEVPTRTRRRWRAYFATQLVESARWREIRAHLDRPVDESRLPGALLECIPGGRAEVLISGLLLLLHGPRVKVRDGRMKSAEDGTRPE